MIWYSHLSKSFPQFVMIHTEKGFSVVDETEIDVFLKFPCFLYNPVNVGNSISSSSSFSKPRLDIWKFLVHIMLKPSMQDFKYDLTSVGGGFNCPMTSTFFSTTLPGNCDDQIRSVAQSCPTLCDPMNRSTPGLPVHHQLPEFTETHVHRVSDAIQPSHPPSSPSPLAPNPSQHQSLFQ